MHTMHTFHLSSLYPLYSKGFHALEGMRRVMHTARIPMHTAGVFSNIGKKAGGNIPDAVKKKRAAARSVIAGQASRSVGQSTSPGVEKASMSRS